MTTRASRIAASSNGERKMTDSRPASCGASHDTREHVDEFDAIVIGAGISGLYQTYSLREAGLSVRCFEEGAGVGGTWYWNRYPGCAFDSPSEEYGYSFSDELLQEWDWKHYYSFQPEAEAYLNRVADKFALRGQIRLNSRVKSAQWYEGHRHWEVELESGELARAPFLLPAVGGLGSAPYTVDLEGADRFQGEQYHTGRWPSEALDFIGKRVAVIGTGPSAIQLIPELAKRCKHLTVFQRTPNYALPADNALVDPEVQREWKANYAEIHRDIRTSYLGIQCKQDPRSGRAVPKEERLGLYEEAWKRRGYAKFMSLFHDLMVDREINAEYAEWLRGKIRQRVTDPLVAAKLLPDHPFGAKPAMLESGYYETFNRDHVRLVDVKETPIQRLTENGIRTSDRDDVFDVIIYATGFDARTGPLTRIDIRGVGGQTIKGKWDEHGFTTYLGLTIAGFPNLLLSIPAAICSTYTPCVEWVDDLITQCILYMRKNGYSRVEPTQAAEDAWVRHHDELGSQTLFDDVETSWLTGTNIPGRKRRRHNLYAKTGPLWRAECHEVVENGYRGLDFRPVAA
jgi:cation diffusion facilitator CzcD-associated flavoprotein CzcO